MKKRFFIALLLLILLSTYSTKLKNNFSSKILIKKITVENNNIVKEEEIKKKLSYLHQNNIFFLNTRNLKDKIKEIQFIESYQIKKVYPGEIKIKIVEKKPIAIIQNEKKKKYFSSKGELIDFIDLEKFRDLPIIFGDGPSFLILYNNLRNINFPLKEIKKFYLFESRRWDLLTIKNQLIKLPTNDYDKSIINFMSLKNQPNFAKYKIFDYRISNQLILK